jgi:peptidoglycan hydrolase CwlO-like protein
MENISVSVLCTIGGFIVALITLQRKSNKDIRADTREEAETKAKLDYISKGVDDIRIDIKAQQRDIQELKERVIKNEASLKSAHKRIDNLEGDV